MNMFNKPLQGSLLNNQYFMENIRPVVFSWLRWKKNIILKTQEGDFKPIMSLLAFRRLLTCPSQNIPTVFVCHL